MKTHFILILLIIGLLPYRAYVQNDSLLPWEYIDTLDFQYESPIPNLNTSENEEEVESLWLANNLAGVAPSDILFVSSQNKYFVYGYHRIVVIDATTREFLDAIDISSYGRQYLKNFGLHNGQESNNLAYNPISNEVYCFTEDQKLLCIDPINHQIKAVIKSAAMMPNDFESVYWNYYLHYDTRSNKIFLAIVYPNITDDYKTIIHIYNGSQPYNKLKTINYDQQIRGFSVNKEYDKIYLTSDNRFEIIDFDGLIVETQEVPYRAGNILYINDEVNNIHVAICFPDEYLNNLEDRIAFIYNGETDALSSFTILRKYVTSVTYNAQLKRIYLAHNDYNYGIDVINAQNYALIQSVDFTSNYADKNIRNLTVLNNKIFGTYANSIDDVGYGEGAFYLDAMTHTVTHYEDIPLGFTGRIAVNVVNNEVVTTNYSHGSLSFISTSDNTVYTLHTGGSAFTGTYNNIENKLYTYNKSVGNLFIQDLDNNTSKTIDFDYFGYSGYISDVVFDEIRNRIYVSIYANTNKVKIIDGVTDQLLETEIILTDTYCTRLFVGKNDKLYSIVGPKDNLKRMIYTDLNTLGYLGARPLGVYNQLIFAWFEHTKDDDIILAYSPRSEEDGKIMIFDKNDNTLLKFFDSKSFVNLAYNPLNNKIYNQRVIFTPSGTTFTNQLLVTNLDNDTKYSVYLPEKVLTLEYCAKENILAFFSLGEDFSKVTMIDGQSDELISYSEIPNYASGIKYNPVNGKLYSIHPAMGDAMNGVKARFEVQTIDYFNQIVSKTVTNTNETFGLYPVMFITNNNAIINTTDNQIMIPTGYHSKIIVINCSADELLLQNRYNWVSYPKLEREGDDPFNTRTLLERLQPLPEELTMEGRFPQDPDPHYFYKLSEEWIENQIPNVQSSRGYKLNTSDGFNNLPLYGSILSPDTPIEVYTGYDNWVGYFLQHSQSPLDAFAHLLPDLSFAKGYGWLLHRGLPTAGPGGETIIPPDPWRVEPAGARIRYGDMAIVRVKSDRTFVWSPDGEPGPRWEPSLTEYFTYDEKADYDPIIIELDSINKPDEIGAFINDSCVGACKVETSDSTVLLRAYIETGSGGDSLSFQMHYATKSSPKERIRSYYVFDERKNRSELRAIKTGEGKGIYYVSFKAKPGTVPINTDSEMSLSLHPNPAKDMAIIQYTLPTKQNFILQVLDMQGRSVAMIEKGLAEAGSYSVAWNIMAQGAKLNPGMYYVRLQSNQGSATAKLIIKP